MFFAERLFHIPAVKEGGEGKRGKKMLRSSMRNEEEIRMNKYIQRNALANEIITIKRFATFYVPRSFCPP